MVLTAIRDGFIMERPIKNATHWTEIDSRLGACGNRVFTPWSLSVSLIQPKP